MAAKPIKNEIENWTQDYSTYFCGSIDAFEVKFEIEKTIGLLLAGDAAQTAQLTYSGSDNPPFIGREVQLRFEAASPKGELVLVTCRLMGSPHLVHRGRVPWLRR
jgi:hypothetical protein